MKLWRKAKAKEEEYIHRFSLSQRVEHLILLVSFAMLVITGLPQKYPNAFWAHWLVQALGSVDMMRLIHRTFGVVFALLAVYHLVFIIWHVLLKRGPLSMMPTLKDARDAWDTVRFSMAHIREKPKFDRYDFRQKFEYWGIIFGGVIMIITGAILMYPTVVTRWLPGVLVPAAKEFHTNEALLALLTIVVWHLYGGHFGTAPFPYDPSRFTSIFTGKISRKALLEEHPLEYARFAGSDPEEGPKGAGGGDNPKAASDFPQEPP